MEVKTAEIEKFLELGHAYAWYLKDLIEQIIPLDLPSANQTLIDFEQKTPVDLRFKSLLNEVRKNLILMNDVSVIYNYKSYIEKSFNDNLSLVQGWFDAEQEVVPEELQLYRLEGDPPYKNLSSTRLLALNHLNLLKANFWHIKQIILDEVDFELELRSSDVMPVEKYRVAVNRREGQEKFEKLTHKQQILLLHFLGSFELPTLASLTDIQKGYLFGRLLGLDKDNTENYIRYKNGRNVKDQYNIKTEKNIQIVKGILKEVGLEK
ncbi:hypothetical protein [Segetibacter aerophilus]|uniref:Uncharacterized protein n=1 Tax=Segetibacter aerophilus TaxID=670293 RepID=A0A512BBY5_9BACT|nr:hypothetical protein [Segetibacter aerophilus]GEO09489.1 hypothetical protein SAE01_19850 [Segetibacter aerophilus]